MISIEAAKAIAESFFPRGVEEIAKRIDVPITRTPLTGCDGWCVCSGTVADIVVNSDCSEARQRFTVAHELSHLLLGIEPQVVTSSTQPFKSDAGEETRVNELTGQLLLPETCLKSLITQIPVDGDALRKVARRGKVSEIMAACRIAKRATSLGLENAAVVAFEGETAKWCWSRTLEVPKPFASFLLKQAAGFRRGLYRHQQEDGQVITASILGDPASPVLFVQLLPDSIASQKTDGEAIREAADWLFGKDHHFRCSVNGCISSFKTKHAQTMSLEEAVNAFIDKHSSRWGRPHRQKLESLRGRHYLSLRLAEWFPGS